MDLTNARAGWNLQATAARTAVNTAGSAIIGTQNGSANFTDADIAYSLTVTSTGTSDKATLNLATGAVVQTTGTPSVTRRGTEIDNLAAEDFEGATLPTTVTIYAIMIDATPTSGDVICEFSATDPARFPNWTCTQSNPGTLMTTWPNGEGTSGNLAITMDTGDTATITIIGKSS